MKVCGASDSQDLPPNFIKLAKDAYTPDVMAASDCMLGNMWHYVLTADFISICLLDTYSGLV
jgi:hypothetical protein